MKINNLFTLAINNTKRKKTNIIFIILLMLINIAIIVGFSSYKSLFSFWNDWLDKSYQFNLVNINSGSEDVISIAESLKDNEFVRDVFFNDEYYLSGIASDFVDKNIDGNIKIIGTIPKTKKIIYGQDLNNEINGIICPNNFLPDSQIYLGNYNIDKVIDLKNILNKNINIKLMNEYNTSLKLIGIFDSSYDYSSPDVCYATHETIKELNHKYQPEFSKNPNEAFILFDNINNAEKVLSKYQRIDYTPVATIKTDIASKILSITNISTIILIIIFFIFTYLICSHNIIKDSKNIGILKICGYDLIDIKKLYYFEYIIIFLISFILSIIISLQLCNIIPIYFFNNNPVLSFLNIHPSIIIIFITLILNILIVYFTVKINIKKIEEMDISEIIYE